MSKPEVTVHQKSFAFAAKIYFVCKMLREERREYELASQLIRSATSVCANLEEAVGGHSERDFHAKVSISYKEARETHFWIRFLQEVKLLTPEEAVPLLSDAAEIVRILGSIQLTMRKKLNNE